MTELADIDRVLIIGEGGHSRAIKRLIGNKRFPGCSFIAIGDNRDRKKVSELMPGPFFVLIDDRAIIFEDAQIGEGSVVMPGAIIQPNVKIGKHCIINTGATVDHDCVLEDYVHIAPGAHLCGGVHVGEGALVGVGVGVAPMAQIPAWSICKAARLDICPMPTK